MAALVKISFGLLISLSAIRFLTAQEHFKIPDNIETRWSSFENPMLRRMADQKKKLRDLKTFRGRNKSLASKGLESSTHLNDLKSINI
jgi:hypothetical protein